MKKNGCPDLTGGKEKQMQARYVDEQRRYPKDYPAFGKYLGDYKFSKYGIGSVYAMPTSYGVRLEAYFKKGDPAQDWNYTRDGWNAYEYTHGGYVYRYRCQMLADLAADLMRKDNEKEAQDE